MEVCKYDPAHEWDKYCTQEERELAKRQICSICDQPITDDECYLINGGYICRCCMTEYFMVDTPVEGE